MSALARRLRGARFGEPGYFLLRALALVALFSVLHAAGLREETSFLALTAPPGETFGARTVMLGGAYLAAWLALVALAPALCIADLFVRLASRRGEG